MLEESRRRHGLAGKREGEKGVVGELAGQLWGRKGEEEEVLEGGSGKGRSEEEERLRLLRGGKR